MKINDSRVMMIGAIALATVVGMTGAGAQSDGFVIKARKIYTVSNGVIENGAIVVNGGKIRAVGRDVTVPASARVYQAEAVIPGLIDAHSHMALDRSGGGRGPINAEFTAADHFDPRDPNIAVALSGGVTSMITRPGSGIISSGRAVAIKLRSDPTKDMILKRFVDLKMAIRPLIRLRPGETPATLMGWYAAASEQFRLAKAYVHEQDEFVAGRRPVKPAVDERLESFAAVLRGQVMVHVHVHYPGEIMMAMHLAREYGFIDRLALSHAQEAYPIASLLAKTKIVSVVGPMFITRFYGDTRSHNVIKELMDAGAIASMQTDESEQQARDFREYGSLHIRHGLKETQALEALTINGAKAMMLADRIGSIEVGKDADLVLLDGPLFDLHAGRVEKVFVDGVLEYERTAPLQTESPTVVGGFKPMRGALRPGDRTFALTHAHVFTISHGTIANATVVVQDGRFTAVQAGLAAPSGMPVVDLGGRAIVPGWVTAKASPNDWMGDMKWQLQNNENIEPIVPEMNARFAIDPWFPSFGAIREVGITTQQITPAQLNLVGGNGVVIKTDGMDVEQMVRKDPSSLVFSLIGQTVRTWGRNSQIPLTLSAASRAIRDALDRARAYAERKQGSARPEYSQRLEAFLPALEGKVPIIVQAYTVEEIREAIKLAEDYKLSLIVSGGIEAHVLASELARIKAGVILGNAGSEIGEYETIRGGGHRYSEQSPALLSKAGVKVSFFGASGSRRIMPTGRLGGEPALNAAWAFRNGASEQEALRMVTLTAAEMMGMGDRIGSIDPGKDADFMVLEGHPFDYRVLPQMVFIDGQLVHQLQREAVPAQTSRLP